MPATLFDEPSAFSRGRHRLQAISGQGKYSNSSLTRSHQSWINRQRMRIVGRHLDGQSCATLAEQLGRDEEAVRALYVRALRKLREECREG